MNRIQEKIEQYKHELSNVPTSDSLVHAASVLQFAVDEFSLEKFVFPIAENWKRLLKTAGDLIKEADVNPLCFIPASISWKIQDKEVLTPLVLYPVQWKVDKVRNQVELQPQYDSGEINPYIRFLVKEKAGLVLEPQLDEFEKIDIKHLVQALIDLGFECELNAQTFFANLHYHRFHLLRELELLSKQAEFAQPLLQLFDENNTGNTGVKLTSSLLTNADTDQLKLFQLYAQGNLVVQGPPGTGKSQVILNVLGKLLDKKQRVLVLSEKRVALEVIEKKLNQLNLGSLAFVCHSQTGSKQFLEKLEATWRLLEQPKEDESYLDLFSERMEHLQLFLDRLNQPDLIGGISFADFLVLAEETPFQTQELRIDAPDTRIWLEYKAIVQEIEQRIGSFQVLHHLRPSFFQHSNGQRLLESLQAQWQLISATLEINTWKDVSDLYHQLGRLQLVDNAFFSFYSKINNKNSEKRKYEKAVKRFKIITKELELIEVEMKVWKKIPSQIQLESWAKAGGFLGKRKLKKELNDYLNGTIDLLPKAHEVWQRWWSLKNELIELEKLFLSWEITPTEAQIDAASYVFTQFEKEGSALFTLAEMDESKRKKILSLSVDISQFYTDFRLYFQVSDEKKLTDFFLEKINGLQHIQILSALVKNMPHSLVSLFEFAENWQDLQTLVLKANWVRLETYFPDLAKHSGSNLLEKLKRLSDEQEEGFSAFAQVLLNKQKEQFQQYHALLLTPSSKLTSNQKELKGQLKRGKALLVKEFGKSRQHQSLRNLLESEARIWIQTCIPIWMSTPGLVADNFPLEPNLVDHLIIDEASQMPLPNALGSIQRANQVLITGDEQQMSPSSFFGKTISEHDVLHQAGFYFNRTTLHHHYRSANPSLIDFSNRHFYENRLVVYPKPGNNQAVYHHYVEDGKFVDRVNSKEAKEVAAYISKQPLNNSLGLVAFSKEQLNAIWKEIPSKTQQLLIDLEEEGRFFMKALDEVQGDEADQIIVSLGYARDEAGKFALRFGPLNHSNGYKRLNVLLTRAIQELHFFCSVRAENFPLSDNENVNLLRQYLTFLETVSTSSTIQFPYGIVPERIENDKVWFKGLEYQISSAQELLTFVKMMQYRGWEISLS